MPSLFRKDDNWIDSVEVGFDDFCDFYDQSFCYRVCQSFAPPTWSGYRAWFDWEIACSNLWGHTPAFLVARSLAHMRERQDPRLDRLGEWIYAHEADPEHYRQQLELLCRGVTGFSFYAK